MSTTVRTLSGILVAIVATGLGALAIAADGPKPAAPAAARPVDMAQHHGEMIQRHLDAAAARLEIKASQQSAWQAYTAVVRELANAEGMPARPAADADAATTARERAERATVFARRLTAVADATARLQSVLSPEQQSVLAQITRHAGMHAGFGAPMMMHRRMMDGASGEGRCPMDRAGDHGQMDHEMMERGGMDHREGDGAN